MTKKIYKAPELEEIKVAVECGFMLSGDGSSMDYGDGGDGELLD